MNLLKNHAIIASAGTGKTEQLALRYIKLLDRSSPDKTLAVTFTKNAAGEILERIIKLLVNAYFLPSEKKSFEAKIGFAVEKSQIQKWLIEIITHLPRISISTIDSFFYQIVSCYPLELGLNSAPDIVQGYVDKKIQKKVLKQLISRAKAAKDFLSSLKILIQAISKGKESRKLSVIIEETIKDTYSIFLDSKQGAWDGISPPKNINDLPEWNLMIEQLAALNEKDNKTFAKHIEKLKNNDFIAAITKGPVNNYLSGKEECYRIKFTDEIKKLLQNISDYAVAKILEEENRKTKAIFGLMTLYDKFFNEAKASENVINYSDIYKLLIGGIAAQNDSDGLHIYYRLDAKLDNFLIDEFQDTNREQWQALNPLADEVIQSADDARTYFMVGDIKQSIYGWRGGDPRLFLKICEKYNIQPESLVKSYRSGKNILEAVNVIAAAAPRHWRESVKFENHVSAIKTPGYFEFRKVENEENDEKPIHKQVYELIKKIDPLSRKLTTAILFRGKKELDNMADYLKFRGINCAPLGSSSLFQKSSARRMLSLFELTDNPKNKIALYHLTEKNSYLKKIIPADSKKRCLFLKKLRAKLIYNSYASVISEIFNKIAEDISDAASKKYIVQLVELAEQYEKIKTTSPKDFVDFVEQTEITSPETGDEIILSTIHGAKGLGFDMVILPELTSAAKPQLLYTKKADIDLLGNEPEIETVTSLGKNEFINAMPEYKIIREQHQICYESEMMNLLYVALTRARKGLYLFLSDSSVTTKNKIRKMSDVLLPAFDADKETPAGILKSFGEPNWYENEAASVRERPPEKQIEKITLKKNASRFRPYQTPSSLHDSRRKNAALIFSRKGRRAREKGTIIHALFQEIIWLNSANISRENLVEKARETVPFLNSDFYEETVSEFLKILEKEEIKNLLTEPEEKCEVKNELPFAAIIDDKLTRGAFDRVIFYPSYSAPEKIEIIDYKTDNVQTDEEIKTAVEKYKPQMDCYKKALSESYGLDAKKITARLVFTTPEQK